MVTSSKRKSKSFSLKLAHKTDVSLSPRARAELAAMGLGHRKGKRNAPINGIDPVEGRPLIRKRAISAPRVINEAYDYSVPSSFSRGMRVELPGASMLFFSGTASVDEKGETLHAGDLPAQCLRTFRNLTGLLASEGASWHDVIRTTCYLKDIKRDYCTFNKMRTMFMKTIGLTPLPASTGIQARLCRPDLLVEIEAIAVIPNGSIERKE